MKIVCSSCGAKYSIADEKVEGKVFKIRCKKCSNVIMVKGTGGEDSVSDQHSGDGAAEWYVVIDGEQVGPITSMEIDSYFMAGQVDAETFVWRDGLSDWLPMRELTEFGHLIQETAGPEEKTQISSGYSGFDQHTDSQPGLVDDADETVSMTTGGSSAAGLGGGDPFGLGQSDSVDDFSSSDTDYQGGFSGFGDEASSPSEIEYAAQDQASEPMSGYGESAGGFDSFESGGGAAVSASEPASSDQGGMFASFDSGSSEGGDDDFLGFSSADSGSGPSLGSRSSGSSAGAASNGASLNGDGANNMIGQRNENSVLFSLSSLDQVQAVSSPSGGGGGGGGHAGGSGGMGAEAGVTEGSGLIDIRSLASAHQSMKGGGQESETVDPFSGGTMAMPALMPMGSHRSNKGLIIAGIIFGVLFLGVAVAAVVVIATSSDKEPQTKVVEKVKYIEKEVAAATGDDSKAADEAAKAEQEALAAAEANDDKAEEEDEEVAEKDAKEASKKTTQKSRDDRRSRPEKAAPTPTPPKKTAKSGDSIDDLLKGIDNKDEEKPAPKPEPKKTTAKSELSRDDVQNTVRRYSGRIATCKRTQNKNNLDGTMWVKFSIRPNGRTSNVSVLTGKFNGTDLGRCVQKAVQGMRFPATSATKNVDIAKFPFKL